MFHNGWRGYLSLARCISRCGAGMFPLASHQLWPISPVPPAFEVAAPRAAGSHGDGNQPAVEHRRVKSYLLAQVFSSTAPEFVRGSSCWILGLPQPFFITGAQKRKTLISKNVLQKPKKCSLGCIILLGTPTCCNSRIPKDSCNLHWHNHYAWDHAILGPFPTNISRCCHEYK